MTDDGPTSFSAPAPHGSDPAAHSDEPVARLTLLDELRAEAQQEARKEPVTYMVATRPGWSVRYDTNIDDQVLGQWRKRAADKTQPEGVNQLKLCLTVLANHAEVFVRNGVDALDEEGQPISFRSQYLIDLLGVGRAVDAVKKWYGADGEILSTAYSVLDAAGYGRDADEGDPT